MAEPSAAASARRRSLALWSLAAAQQVPARALLCQSGGSGGDAVSTAEGAFGGVEGRQRELALLEARLDGKEVGALRVKGSDVRLLQLDLGADELLELVERHAM